MANLHNIIAIAIGGAIGAVCRHGVNIGCRRWLGEAFAYGTLTVKMLGDKELEHLKKDGASQVRSTELQIDAVSVLIPKSA